MKEMFSKLISFLIGFCSYLFGRGRTKEKDAHFHEHNYSNADIKIYIQGGIKMTFYCNNKQDVLAELEHQDWKDLLIQHPDMSAEERFSVLQREQEEEPLADTNSLLKAYIDRMNDSDAVLVFLAGDSEINSIVLLGDSTGGEK